MQQIEIKLSWAYYLESMQCTLLSATSGECFRHDVIAVASVLIFSTKSLENCLQKLFFKFRVKSLDSRKSRFSQTGFRHPRSVLADALLLR